MTAFLSALIGAFSVILLVLQLTRGAALRITHSTSYLRVLSTRGARRMQVSSFGKGLDLSADWSRSIVDIPHRFVASGIYEVPFKSHNSFLNALVGGWEITGIFQAQSGQLVDIQSGIDSNRNGDNAGDRAILNPNGDRNVGSQRCGADAGQSINGVVNLVPLGSSPNVQRSSISVLCESKCRLGANRLLRKRTCQRRSGNCS